MSVDAETRQILTDVIRDWAGQGKMFTAFEVSLAAKEKGVDERHRHMRDAVHEVIFKEGGPLGYTRTLRDVGAPQQAWVYHLPNDNPYQYVPLERAGKKKTADETEDEVTVDIPLVIPLGVRNPVALQTIKATPSTIPEGAYGTDQRGRVCIPVTLVARLGVSPGMAVNVSANESESKVLITRHNPGDPIDPDTSYTVESDGNIRITQGTLEKAGIDGLQTYRIEGNASMITVTEFDWDLD